MDDVQQQQDRIIRCVDCKQEFTFTVGEQQFFANKDFSDPKRCKSCREINKQEKQGKQIRSTQGRSNGGAANNTCKTGRSDRSERANDQAVNEDAVERVFVPDERRQKPSRKRKRQPEDDYHEVWESPRSRRRKGDE